jgi:hypothetical protein
MRPRFSQLKLRRSSRRPLLLLAQLGLLAVLASAAWGAAPYIEVAAYYFPNYHPDPQNEARYGTNWSEWNLVQAAKPRFPGHQQPVEPAWGYGDEAQPAVMAGKIAAAADHGVTAWIFDWYWHDTGPFLERGLEQGFLRATNTARLKFAVMWANHDWVELFPAKPRARPALIHPGPVSRETFDQATGHVIGEYFPKTNYWRIAGKPYFSIYELTTLIKGLGGLPATRVALENFRARTRAAGFPDLHLNAVMWGLKPEPALGANSPADLVRALGVDSVTSYAWIHDAALTNFPATDYRSWAAQATQFWPRHQRAVPVPYFPNVSLGWDPTPRTLQTRPFREGPYPYTAVAVGNSPPDFRQALLDARSFVEAQKTGPRVVVLNAWNEWTEGSHLEPDTVNGLRYLEMVREVFPPTGQ